MKKILFIVTMFVIQTIFSLNLSAGVVKPTKKIFISDVHMGSERSIHPQLGAGYKPYGWFGKNAPMLAAFLRKISKDSSVGEVVILGDLLDGWVCPLNFNPLNKTKNIDAMFEKIASASQNKKVIAALKAIALDPEKRLIYVPGNHDMLLTKEVLTKIIPGIEYLGVSPGAGKFDEDGIVAEHGSLYSLFNAPDRIDYHGHTLPLGYFISRAAAYYAAKSGNVVTTPEILRNVYKKMEEDKKISKKNISMMKTILASKGAGLELDAGYIFPLSQLIYEVVYNWFLIEANEGNIMNGIDNFDKSILVKDVSKKYRYSYHNWPQIRTNSAISSFSALMNDTGSLGLKTDLDLWSAAYKVYIKDKETSPKIIIFGHTHQNALIKDYDLLGTGKTYIYANTGSWIDKGICTFVETEVKADGKHYVRVKQYKKDGDIQLIGEKSLDISDL